MLAVYEEENEEKVTVTKLEEKLEVKCDKVQCPGKVIPLLSLKISVPRDF